MMKPSCVVFTLVMCVCMSQAQPVADFQAQISCDVAVFTDNSSGNPVFWLWDFGDGSTSTQQSPTHMYSTTGNYNTTLIVGDSTGIRDTLTRPVVITSIFTAFIVPDPSDTICAGGDTRLTAVPGGGTAPYTYLWNNNGTGSSLHIAPGTDITYSVQISDANGCTASDVIHIVLKPAVAITIASTSGSRVCYGYSTVLTASGGIQYEWSTGDSFPSISVSPTVYTSYTVTVTAANGCTGTKTANVRVDPVPVASITGPTNICSGETVQLTANPGGASYFYDWVNGSPGRSINVSPTVTTTYWVTVINAIGCTDTAFHTVIVSNPLVSISPQNTTICSGQTIHLTSTASGGTSSYGYLWSPGGDTTCCIDVSPTATTTYSVTATDADGCTSIDSTTVTVMNGAPFTLSLSGTNASCNGVCNGTATVNVSGGTPPFQYDWTNIPDSTANVLGLCAGNFTVTVTDSNGCMANSSVLISDAATVILSIIKNDLLCNGACNGSATVTQSGGTPPFTYTWSSGTVLTGNSVSGLCAGQHTVAVTDSVGCVVSDSFLIVSPPPLAVVATSVPLLCGGDCDGTASAAVTGGTPPYSYLWSTGLTSPTATGLCEGKIRLTVMDSNLCQSTDSVDIIAPPALTLVMSKQDVSCNSTNDGAASVRIEGGTSPYAITWSPGITSNDTVVSGLEAGTYSVTVVDNDGCPASSSINVVQPGFSASASVTNSSCGNADGSITISVSDTVAQYNYLWNTIPVQNTASAAQLAAGNYVVTITSSTGCTDTLQISVSDAGSPTLSDSTQSATCHRALNGSINLMVVNGTAPFSFLWNNGATTEDLHNISPAVYNVVVTDSNGCSASRSVIVGIERMSLVTSTTPASCLGSDGTATVFASGGVPPYYYAWSDNQSTQTAINLASNWYSVTVTDSSNCSRHINVFVDHPANCDVTISGTVYYDINSNCIQDTFEQGIPNVMIDFTPRGAVYTDQNGDYIYTLPVGTYTVTQVTDSATSTICPSSGSYNVTLNTGGMSSVDNDFANHITSVQDLSILVSCGTARPGFNQATYFTVYNAGNLPANGFVEFTVNQQLTFLNATPSPHQISGNLLTFNITNLPVNGYKTFTVYTSVPATTPLALMIQHSASVLPLTGDINTTNNFSSCAAEVTGSYDPNDKQVLPEGLHSDGHITQDDTLMHYTIRFQNTGSDTAFTVVIKDTLDSDLDYKTFKHTSSHQCRVHFEEDQILVFTFENILLPDSNVNEAESHGLVSYYIEHKGRLPFGTTISNRAAIYFDYNAPIITNTVINKIFDPTGVREMFSMAGNISIYPNPAQDVLTIEDRNGILNRIIIADVLGNRIYESARLNSARHQINLGDLSKGIYFISVFADSGLKTKKLLVE